MSMGVIPVNMQSASLDVVRNAFAIRMFTRRCTQMYLSIVLEVYCFDPYGGAIC